MSRKEEGCTEKRCESDRDVLCLLGVRVLTVMLMFLKILQSYLECCFYIIFMFI